MHSSTHASNAHTHIQTDRHTHTCTYTYSSRAEDTGTVNSLNSSNDSNSELTTYTQQLEVDWTRELHIYKILRTPLHTHTYVYVRIYIYIRALYLKYVRIDVHTDRHSVGPR